MRFRQLPVLIWSKYLFRSNSLRRSRVWRACFTACLCAPKSSARRPCPRHQPTNRRSLWIGSQLKNNRQINPTKCASGSASSPSCCAKKLKNCRETFLNRNLNRPSSVMKSVFAQTFRNSWVIGLVHAGLWVLLVLSVTSFGGKSPVYQESTAVSNPLQTPIPVTKLPNLFSPNAWPTSLDATNALSPFFTRHFIPPVTPPPPAPTSRKIELTYQGFYQPVNGARHVIVKLADAFLDKTIGANLTA